MIKGIAHLDQFDPAAGASNAPQFANGPGPAISRNGGNEQPLMNIVKRVIGERQAVEEIALSLLLSG
ncbi:MAG: hypothetical protein WCD86_07600 [Ktedonobacteraceae bacterium]